MRFEYFLSLLLLLFALPAATPARSRPAPGADTIFLNGAVYTLNREQPWAEAVATSRGRIVHVGSERDVMRFRGKHTRIVDLRKGMLLPGFHDAHVHPVEGGIELGECVLNDCKTPADMVARVKQYAEANSDLPWIRGGGWELPIFPDANPSKSLLDEAVPDRPVFLTAADGHSAWVNSRALQLAGITRATPDPPNGRIERDPATGEPTGTLRESASDLVASKIPPRGREETLAGARRAIRLANELGITSLQEANASDAILEAYAELERRGELTVRVVAAMSTDVAKGPEQVRALVSKRDRHASGLLRARAAKIFVDGVIEAKTAALLAPYLGEGEQRGDANLTPDALDSLVLELDKQGFQVHVHAIGDRAIRMSLDAFERAAARNGRRDSRHHVAHLELIDPDDIPRFRRLGVAANFQPLWAYADTYITKLTEPVLGPERSRWLYPIGSVMRSGAMVAAGSDWSVSSMNPLDAIQVAVTRRGTAAESGPAWIPEETVSLPDILAAYTINGAWINFQERTTGSIAVGKDADLIVLDRNLFEIPAGDIHKARVVRTFLAGREVYRAPETPRPTVSKTAATLVTSVAH